MSGYGIPEPPLDPPDDPPLVTCPECEGEGVIDAGNEGGGVVSSTDPDDLAARPCFVTCPRCGSSGEAYLTDEEVRDLAAEAAIERAEARRDGYE